MVSVSLEKIIHFKNSVNVNLKLAVKGQGDPNHNNYIVCMSVQCVHWTQGEPGNEATSTAYLHF